MVITQLKYLLRLLAIYGELGWTSGGPPPEELHLRAVNRLKLEFPDAPEIDRLRVRD